jgi:hypothetical protein
VPGDSESTAPIEKTARTMHRVRKTRQTWAIALRRMPEASHRTMEPVLRDAWASLYRWHEEGEHVYRIRTEARALDAQLNLVTAEVMYEGCWL